MSANPGNTGGKFKSFHTKHLVNILFFIFWHVIESFIFLSTFFPRLEVSVFLQCPGE